MNSSDVQVSRGNSIGVPDATVQLVGDDAFNGIRAFRVNGEIVPVRWKTGGNGIAGYVDDLYEYRIESPEGAQRFAALHVASGGESDIPHIPAVVAIGKLETGETVFRTTLQDDLSPKYPKAWNEFHLVLHAWHKAKNEMIERYGTSARPTLMDVGTAITDKVLADRAVPQSLKDAYDLILAQLPQHGPESTGFCLRLNRHDFRVDERGELVIYEGVFDAKRAGYDLPLTPTPLGPILAEMTNPAIRGLRGVEPASENQLGFTFSMKRPPPISVTRFEQNLSKPNVRMMVPSL